MHTNPQTKGQTFSLWEEEENLVFELLLTGTSDFNK